MAVHSITVVVDTMIVTVATVVVLVIGVLSLGLALYGGFISTAIMEGGVTGQQSSHNRRDGYQAGF